MYDLIIIGGGPAASAAGVYAARKKIKTLLVAESFGGQSIVSQDIQNWIGTPSISGYDLAQSFETHLRAQEDIEIETGELIKTVSKEGDVFVAMTEGGKRYETKTVLITTGGRRRKLGVKGEKEFDGKGVAYCSICDAPLFGGKVVAVVGGGNAGLEAVIDLLPYATKIYLLQRSGALKGDAVTQERIMQDPKVEVIFNATTLEIIGDSFVNELVYVDTTTNGFDKLTTRETHHLDVQGVFIEIGSLPNSELVKDVAATTPYGEIEVDVYGKTSMQGIWAAGDVTNLKYKQNNIAAGDAIRAVLNIYDYLMYNK
ncbi:MAG: FAD-dependent oxidoreductase [Parcubacteria group bacterium]|nr:FAD-dependent oxidoreductase [Parcubacteria group bacterium]